MTDPTPTDRTQVQTAVPSASSLLGLPTIPGYDVLREIGRGGMGVVYEARQTKLDRKVALKLMLSTDPLNKARFLAEGQVIAAVKHPNVVEVHDFGECDGVRAVGSSADRPELLSAPYIAMEYLTGGTLADRIKAGPAFAPRVAAELIARVAAGVGAAHDLGIVHRDLKPGNVLLAADGTPKVADFGLAKRTASDLTRTQDAAGTPAYMAPEQAKAMKFVGPPADVWSLGVMLYECLTGRKPFVADTDLELLITIQESNPPTLRAVSKSIPHDLETVCLKCLEKEPDRRYPTANGLAADLEAWIEGKPIAARRATRIERAVLWGRRNPTAAAAWVLTAAVVLLGAFAATATALWREAVAEKGIAEGLKGQAEEARDAAEGERRRAEVAEGIARKVKDDIADERERLAFARNVNLAHLAFQGNELPRARMFLDLCPPKLRGWDWHYVHRLCHPHLLSLGGHTAGVIAAAFAPDGRRIVTASADKTARVWDARTGRPVVTFKGHADIVQSARFSPDGERIVSAGDDKTAKVWDAKTGTVLQTLGGHAAGVTAAAFSPDGARIVTASWDDTAKVWDAKEGREIFALKGHSFHVKSAAFSPDGARIVTASFDATAKVWDAKTGAEVLALKGHDGAVYSAAFSPDGDRIVTAGKDETAKVWNAATGANTLTLRGHNLSVTAAAFSSDGSRIVTTSDDRAVRNWDAASGKLLLTVTGHEAAVNSVAFSQDGRLVVTASEDHTARVFDAMGEAHAHPRPKEESPDEIRTRSPDGSRVVTTDDTDNTATVRDTGTGAATRILKGHADGIVSATFSADGSRIITTSQDKTAKVWDAQTGAELLTLRGHTEGVSCAAFSPDATRVVTGSWDRTVKIWDAKTGFETLTLKGHKDDVLSVSFSPDGTRIVTASQDDEVKAWEIRRVEQDGRSKAENGREPLTARPGPARPNHDPAVGRPAGVAFRVVPPGQSRLDDIREGRDE
jgi:WD40 repeat protein